jgi:hypothetical protein
MSSRRVTREGDRLLILDRDATMTLVCSTRMEAKLSEQLVQLLQSKQPSDIVDVIVELYPGEKDETAAVQTRNERIAQSKEAFNRKIVPLEETIKRIAGEITGRAWINDTVRVRVRADTVSLLSGHDEVAKLDTPHPLTRDAIK